MSITLPPKVWTCIAAQIDDPVPRVFIRLAQVCRFYRSIFLADTTWQTLNVYDVLDHDYYSLHCEYTYENYRLNGIAGHFFIHLAELGELAELGVELRRWYLTGQGDAPEAPEQEAYFELHALAHSLEHRRALPRSDEFSVWEMWFTQLHSKQALDWFVEVDLGPGHLQRYLQQRAFIEHETRRCDKQRSEPAHQFRIFPKYEFNFDVNMAAVRAKSPCSEHFLSDKGFALRALDFWPDIYRILDVKLRADWDIMGKAAERGANMKELVQWRLFECDGGLFREIVRNDARNFKSYQGCNRDLVLAAVRHNGECLAYAPERFRDDREIVMTAFRSPFRRPNMLKRYETLLVSHDDVKNRSLLCEASHSLFDDKEVVLAAVSKDCYSLGRASERLIKDYDVVLAAVFSWVRNRRARQHKNCDKIESMCAICEYNPMF